MRFVYPGQKITIKSNWLFVFVGEELLKGQVLFSFVVQEACGKPLRFRGVCCCGGLGRQ